MNVSFYKGISDKYAKIGRNANGTGYIPNGAVTFSTEGHIWVKDANGSATQYGGSGDEGDEKLET